MAAAGCRGQRRFAVACEVLSRRVRAEATAAAVALANRPTTTVPSASSASTTMLLMPGADVTAGDESEGPEASPAQAQAQHQQMTIMYGGRVVVLDDIAEDRAVELMRVAASRKDDMPEDRAVELTRVAARRDDVQAGGGLAVADMRVAPKASLRRFMEKRRDRLAARAPYSSISCPETSLLSASKKLKADEADNAGCWLKLGIPGRCER